MTVILSEAKDLTKLESAFYRDQLQDQRSERSIEM